MLKNVNLNSRVNLEHWFIAREYGRSTCNFFKSLSFQKLLHQIDMLNT